MFFSFPAALEQSLHALQRPRPSKYIASRSSRNTRPDQENPIRRLQLLFNRSIVEASCPLSLVRSNSKAIFFFCCVSVFPSRRRASPPATPISVPGFSPGCSTTTCHGRSKPARSAVNHMCSSWSPRIRIKAVKCLFRALIWILHQMQQRLHRIPGRVGATPP